MTRLIATMAYVFLGVIKNVLTQNFEVWFVGAQRQHDQIGILISVLDIGLERKRFPYQTVDDVGCIGVMVWHGSLDTNVLHDLMLTFTWDGGIGKDDLHLYAETG